MAAAEDPFRQEEARLLAAVAAGRREACRELAGRFLKPIWRLAYGLLREGAEADDVAQEAFLRLWREAPRWRGEARVGTWLHQVVYRLCLDRLRRTQPLLELDEEMADPGEDPERQLARVEQGARVQQALAQLPPRQRTALLLVYFEEMNQREAAQVMGVGVEALESLLARARRGLRGLLLAGQEGGKAS